MQSFKTLPERGYVAVIGYPPPEPLLKQVTEAINQGEPVPLPDEVVSVMTEKRLQEISKRPYTEIHRTFTARREKEKDMIYHMPPLKTPCPSDLGMKAAFLVGEGLRGNP